MTSCLKRLATLFVIIMLTLKFTDVNKSEVALTTFRLPFISTFTILGTAVETYDKLDS